jgi:hypothetical protein
MANELAWLRSKAELKTTDVLSVSVERGAESGIEPGNYEARYYAFEGNLPFRMVAKLRGCKDLINDEYTSEVLRLGTGYRDGETACRFYRTTYTLIAETVGG